MRPFHVVAAIGLLFGLACSGPCSSPTDVPPSGVPETTTAPVDRVTADRAKVRGMQEACKMFLSIEAKAKGDPELHAKLLKKVLVSSDRDPEAREALEQLANPRTRLKSIEEAIPERASLGPCAEVWKNEMTTSGRARVRRSSDDLKEREKMKLMEERKRAAMAEKRKKLQEMAD